MRIHPNEKLALFIDGANLSSTVRALGIEIDFRILLRYFSSPGNLLRAYYFTAILEDPGAASPVRPLVDWLDYNGFTVISRPAREYYDSQSGERRIKGNVDVELVVELMMFANQIDHAVLFSGDGDFRSAVEAVQRQGTKVTVISTLHTRPVMISDDLRRQADFFVDLTDLIHHVRRVPKKT